MMYNALTFNSLPFKVLIAIRDSLVEEGYDQEFANNLVTNIKIGRTDQVISSGDIDVTKIGEKCAKDLINVIELMYDAGFNQKNIVTMVSRVMLLKWFVTGDVRLTVGVKYV